MRNDDAAAQPATAKEVGPGAGPPPLPDVTDALPWRTWADGREEAVRERRPIYVFASSRWSNGAQLFARHLRRDTVCREVLATRFVPILVDPMARPDLAAALRLAALRLGPTAGPPLSLFLDERSGPILPYCSIHPEGDERTPSLASTATSFAEAYESDRKRALAEALRLDAVATRLTTSAARVDGASGERPHAGGGPPEEPSDIVHLHPQRLHRVLDRIEVGADGKKATRALRNKLERACRGGIRDQLGGGFHLCARDPGWIVPHFEKIAPHNAQLAAVFARAARVLDLDQLLVPARECARFAEQALDRGIRALGADAAFYTWTGKEASESLSADLLQAVGLAFHITPSPDRHALYLALAPSEMHRYSHEPVEVLDRRVAEGRIELRRARSRRRPPERIEAEAPHWDAETIRGLAEAAGHELDVDRGRLAAALERLVEAHADPSRCLLARSDGSLFLHDQVSTLAAATAVERLGVRGAWSNVLASTLPAVLERFVTDGAVRDTPGGAPSASIVDAEAPSAIGTLIEMLTRRGQPLPATLPLDGGASTWSWSLRRHAR